MTITDSLGATQTVGSDANGDWSASVPPGSTNADVDETDPDFPDGTTQTEGTDPTLVTAVAGSSVDAGNDGYYIIPGTVTGHLYIDTDGNGNQDAGEPNLANVDVVINDSNAAKQTVTTDANGDWSASVPPGNTSADVDETDPDFPAGTIQTEGTDPTSVTAVANTSVDGGTDGYFIPGTVDRSPVHRRQRQRHPGRGRAGPAEHRCGDHRLQRHRPDGDHGCQRGLERECTAGRHRSGRGTRPTRTSRPARPGPKARTRPRSRPWPTRVSTAARMATSSRAR